MSVRCRDAYFCNLSPCSREHLARGLTALVSHNLVLFSYKVSVLT